MEAAEPDATRKTRSALTRKRVLRAAVQLADERGIEAVTMRSLGRALGVEAMSLYNHVTNKEDLLDGVVEVVVDEIVTAVDKVEPPSGAAGWQPVMRARILAAREVLLSHRWAPALLESRTDIPPNLLPYYESTLALMRAAGFSIDLGHHALHALGTRMLGFTRELFVTGGEDFQPSELEIRQMAARFPNLAELMRVVSHDADSTLGSGCDDQFEFEFGLDVILDGLERLREEAWSLPDAS